MRAWVFLVTVVFVLWAFAHAGVRDVTASAPQLSDNCVLEATVEGIRVYYCEGDYGPDFLINSLGFMWQVQ